MLKLLVTWKFFVETISVVVAIIIGDLVVSQIKRRVSFLS
jgi:hypothetical protein